MGASVAGAAGHAGGDGGGHTKDGDKAKQWYAAVGNDPANTQRTLKVFAICEERSWC